MTRYTYHASHEQFAPAELLQYACQAEAAGFDGIFCSDHLQPWAPSQGHSGHSWAWLGAALQATRAAPFATISVPGGWRYSPVLLAQMIATLGQMFPGRLPWVAFGSGEALNEVPVAGEWPAKAERQRRLREGVAIIRRLLAGECVSATEPPRAVEARIWVQPAHQPQLFAAALTEDTAREVGGWADGLLTLGRDLEHFARVVRAFKEGGGKGKPVHAKVDLCWAASSTLAERQALTHWRFTCLGAEACSNLRQPEDFEAHSASLRPAQMHKHVLITAEPAVYVRHLRQCAQLGASTIDVHHVGEAQAAFIQMFAADVLPALRADGPQGAPSA